MITHSTSVNYSVLKDMIGSHGVLFPKVGLIAINEVINIKSRLLDNLNWQSLQWFDPKIHIE